MYYLHTESGDRINGTCHTDLDAMLAAVRNVYGPCDYGIADGTILDDIR